jgi:hypothetical protein
MFNNQKWKSQKVGKKIIILPSGVTRGELVKGLNAFGSHLNGY